MVWWRGIVTMVKLSLHLLDCNYRCYSIFVVVLTYQLLQIVAWNYNVSFFSLMSLFWFSLFSHLHCDIIQFCFNLWIVCQWYSIQADGKNHALVLMENPLKVEPGSSAYTEETKRKSNSWWKFVKANIRSVVLLWESQVVFTVLYSSCLSEKHVKACTCLVCLNALHLLNLFWLVRTTQF